MGKNRTQDSRNGKKVLLQMWEKFGVELLVDIVESEIDYCDKVQMEDFIQKLLIFQLVIYGC